MTVWTDSIFADIEWLNLSLDSRPWSDKFGSEIFAVYLDDEASEFYSRSFQVIVNNDFDLTTK